MTATLTVSYYRRSHLPDVRGTLLDVYAEVYEQRIVEDPFFSMRRFEERLDGHTSAPEWGCTVGDVAGEVVGYAYGFSRPTGERDDPDGRPTFALCEIMVRAPWRRRGIAHVLHSELMSHRTEERSSLLVERTNPKARGLYESWGYRWVGERLPFPDSPLYDAMMLDLR